jgi:hypothetical protein
VAFSPDSRWLASGSYDRTLKVWNVATGREVRTLTGHTEGVSAVAFSPDGRLLASGSGDKTMKLWETTTGREVLTMSGFAYGVNAVAFSPDGLSLASGSGDGRIEVLDVATRRKLRTLNGQTHGVFSMAFSPDGRWLASGGNDTPIVPNIFRVKLWEASTGRELPTLSGHASIVFAIAFSPDSRWLASGSMDTTVKLWDPATGRELRTLSGHTGNVHAVAFSPDSRWLASGSDDGSIRIWDASTGEVVALLNAVSGAGGWVVVTPEGLFDGSDEGTQKLVAWRIGNGIYPLDRFFNDYYTPGLLARVLAGERPKPKVDLAALKLPPQVHVTNPAGDATVQQQSFVATVEAQDQGGGIAEVRLYQNSKLVGTHQGVSGAKSQYSFKVDLVPGENIIEASALSGERMESNKDPVRVVYEMPALSKPALHLLVVGINTYEDPKFDLDYAQPDAESIAHFFEQHGGLFSSVDTIKLFDKQANKANILHALQQLTEKAHGDDVVLIYLAGHGVGLGEQFYFLSQGMRTEEDEDAAVRKYGITAQALSDTLLRIGALKQILILDTCQSGSALPILAKATMFRVRGLGPAEEKAVKMLARSNGYYLIAASTAEQYAHEVPELGHGVLTSALLSELGEKGDPLAPTGPEGIVTIYALLQYVNQQVPELTEKYYHGNKQYPVSSNTGMDFPLRVR